LDLSADGQRLNDTEKSQLPAEIMLPGQLIAGLGPSHKSSGGGLCVLKKDEIWSGNEKVWHYLRSSKIASGYVQAFHIVEKVVEAQGDNGFLGASGSIQVGIPK
jgi:hypothetical protein